MVSLLPQLHEAKAGCGSRFLRAARNQCYLITVSRLLSLLIMLAFVLTNSAAIAAAVCRHDNLEAHAAARQSGDARVAATAIIEEAAAAAESKQGALADAAGAQLAGFILPPDPALPAPSPHSIAHGLAVDAAKHRSRTVGPLLEPPLA